MFKKNTNIYITILISISFLVCIALDSINHKKTLTVAVGSKTGAYYIYAKKYKEELTKYGIDLNIIETAGAVEIQEQLIDNKVDFAFLQGGLEKLDKGILALANVAYEPVWVLYKDENITSLHDLKGKIINICNSNSGTRPIAETILSELLGMKKDKLKTYRVNKAFNMLLSGEIDALFYVIAYSSSSLKEKIKNPNIHIMSFDDSKSIEKFFIKNDVDITKNNYFKSVKLKKNSISFIEKIPNEDKTLLVKQTILATKDLSDKMARLLLKIAQKVHSSEAFFYSESHFINIDGLKYKQHDASKNYFNNKEYRYENSVIIKYVFGKDKSYYWVAQSLQKIEDFILNFIVFIVLIGFYIEVLYPIYKMLTRKKINRWYSIINKIDTGMEKSSLSELRENREKLKKLLIEIRNTDNINPIHLEAYYSLQHQIHDIIENLNKYIEQKIIRNPLP